MAWKMKSKGKLIEKTVGHLPKELSRAAWFFLERGGNWPMPIPKGGLEIVLEVELKIENKEKKILKRFQDILENNYQTNENIR